MALFAGCATLIALLCVILRRQTRSKPPAPPIPAHVWALGELARLDADRLIEQRAFHVFYVRLSDIVRQYVERRFGLMAPERTTDEFLHELRGDPAFGKEHQQLLARFLRAADMVKFALHEPTPEESGDALDAARGFVEETRPQTTPATLDVGAPDLREAAA